MPEINTPIPTDSLAAPKEPVSFELNPDSAVQLMQQMTDAGFTIWGHGTQSDVGMQSFFDDGLRLYGDYDGLESTAVPLADEDLETSPFANPSFMQAMGPRRNPDLPVNVVLLAFPHADPEHGVTAMQINRHIIDPYDTNKLPPELVVGYYDATSNVVTMNPKAHVTPELREQQLALVRDRQAKIDTASTVFNDTDALAARQFISSESMQRDLPLIDKW